MTLAATPSTIDRTVPKHVVAFVAPPNAISILRAVLLSIPRDFPATFVILHHPGPGRDRPISENLNVSPRLLVAPAADGAPLLNGRAYVLQPKSPLTVDSRGQFVAGNGDLLGSLARCWGAGAIVVALTALSETEKTAFGTVRQAGGHTIALDESDRLWADSSGPRVVADPLDEHLPAQAIGKRMLALLSGSSASLL